MKLPQELPRELNFYHPSLKAKFERVKEYLNYIKSFNCHFFLAFLDILSPESFLRTILTQLI